MKNYLFLCVFFLIFSCTNNKSVYWCGDHPCINNKEKEAYFKKTMIVEVRELKKETNMLDLILLFHGCVFSKLKNKHSKTLELNKR